MKEKGRIQKVGERKREGNKTFSERKRGENKKMYTQKLLRDDTLKKKVEI